MILNDLSTYKLEKKIFVARMARCTMWVCVSERTSECVRLNGLIDTLYLLYNRTWPILMGIHFFMELLLCVVVVYWVLFFFWGGPARMCDLSLLLFLFLLLLCFPPVYVYAVQVLVIVSSHVRVCVSLNCVNIVKCSKSNYLYSESARSNAHSHL